MKHFIYLLVTITAAAFLGPIPKSYAQMQYTETSAYLKANAYWAWYNHIGIDWSSGVPVYDSNRITSLDLTHGLPGIYASARQCAARAVSDPYTGELLFYAGGATPLLASYDPNYDKYIYKIVNRNHAIMPNADSLEGDRRNTNFQGRCIVPMPGDSTKYYVFSLDGGINIPAQLVYCVVDMRLEGGLGDIVTGKKNIYVDSSIKFGDMGPVKFPNKVRFDYGIISIPGNGCDVWLVAHTSKQVDTTDVWQSHYYAYHITENGVDNNPIISTSAIGGTDLHLSVSPNRQWILGGNPLPYFGDTYTGEAYQVVTQFPPSELAKFDPESGQVLTVQNIAFQLPNPGDTVVGDYYNIVSAAFSPDNTKLYTVNSNLTGTQTYLAQFDLSNPDSTAIAQSQVIIDSFGNFQQSPKGIFCMGLYTPALKLYNDTIFVSWGQMNKIGSINKPNATGSACELQIDYFSLPIDKVNGGREFNEVVYPMYTESALVLDTQICQPQVLAPRVLAPYANYKWSNGETDSTITVTSGDLYWVTYSFLSNNCVHIYTDTFKLSWEGINPPPVITVEVDTLSTTVPYASYQWLYEGNVLPGETDPKLTVSSNGDYRVIVTNAEGCRDTSDIYTVTNQTGIENRSGKAAVKIYPNPTRNMLHIQYNGEVHYRILDVSGRALSGLKQGHQVDLSDYAPGVYQLIVLDPEQGKLGTFKVSKL